MTDVSEIVAVLSFLLVFVVAMTVVGAIILRGAVTLYNRLAGAQSDSAVPEPSLGKAMSITFVTSLASSVAWFVFGALFAAAAAAGRSGPSDFSVTAFWLSLPVPMFVMACMLAATLPTTVVRGFLVTVCHYGIVVLISGAVGAFGAVVLG